MAPAVTLLDSCVSSWKQKNNLLALAVSERDEPVMHAESRQNKAKSFLHFILESRFGRNGEYGVCYCVTTSEKVLQRMIGFG